jgi:rhodanese-related sulfurtransferase
MSKEVSVLLCVLLLKVCHAQQADIQTVNPAFSETINGYLNRSVPLISCDTLSHHMDQFVLLDVREKEEYDVSHLPGARYVGYNKFDLGSLVDLPKDTAIVVYCSIGYRSEKIGEKLRANGFSRVYNLYGSIFEWVNEGRTILNRQGEVTDSIHTFNKKWSKWVEQEKATKIW